MTGTLDSRMTVIEGDIARLAVDAIVNAANSSLAAAAGLESVAFPCISTGIHGYPADAACREAVVAVREWLASHELPRVVTFCCFGARDAELYRALV